MKKLLFLLICCLLLSTMGMAEKNNRHSRTSPIKQPLDLFLCIGQSNMAGRATLSPELMDTLSQVYLFNDKDRFEQAVNPLNRYSTIRKDLSMQRLGPSYSFAREMVSQTGRPVGLIVNARGGSSIASWQKGHPDGYYEEAVKKARKAMKYGQLKAILWHQGEANVSNPEKYKQQITALITNIRKDLGIPDLWVVVGEISQWNWTKHETGTLPFNRMIRTINTFLPYSSWVSSEGLMPLKNENDPHFDTSSQLLLGKRYAEQILQHCYKQ